MFSLIIRALGGFTKSEFDIQQASLEGWRARAIAAETTVTLFKEIMTRESDRIKILEEQLTKPQSQTSEAPNLDPVGDRRLSSWPRIRRELEKQNRVKPDAQVPREEIERTIREG